MLSSLRAPDRLKKVTFGKGEKDSVQSVSFSSPNFHRRSSVLKLFAAGLASRELCREKKGDKDEGCGRSGRTVHCPRHIIVFVDSS